MTLQEAIQSGKLFTRQSFLDTEDNHFYEAEEFLEEITLTDITATDYILKPDKLSTDVLANIWNTSKSSTMPEAVNSTVFKRIKEQLLTRGLMEE